jgi:hypothetical protein
MLPIIVLNARWRLYQAHLAYPTLSSYAEIVVNGGQTAEV